MIDEWTKKKLKWDKRMKDTSVEEVVPSRVTCNVSHISFAFLQFETLKYSSMPNAEVIIFLAFKLY